VENANDLLRRCQRGDEEALARLVAMYSERVIRLARRVLGDAGQADEATADAFAKVWSKARQWRGDAEAGTWVYRIAYHAILDHRRRKRWFWVSPPADLVDPKPGPFEQSARSEAVEKSRQRVQDAITKLSEQERALVHLYYFDQLKLAEIGSIVGLTRDVLKMRLARARQKLREMLGDEDLE
jgi:RNA polymerase sigma-70 factor (ECF subfamily)